MSGVYFYEVMFSGGKTTRGLVLTPYERREAASAWIEKQTDGIVVTGRVTVNDRWNISEDAAMPFPKTPLIADEMAYGVAVAAQGAPVEASAINADFNDHRLESPLRPVDALYQDRVKITKPAELFNAFRCSGAIASLDTMAVMHGWSGVNEGNRLGSIDFGNQFIALTELALAADSIGLAVQGVDAGIAVYNGAFNAAKLAEAAANFYVEFPFIPIHITGGLGHGISVPVRENEQVVGMLSLGRDKPFESQAEREHVMSEAIVLASCVHVASARLIVPELVEQRRPRLSPREKECFQLVAAGKSNWDMGCLLGISEAAVAFHVKNLLKKLHVSSRAQAVAIGVVLGMIK